MHRQQTACHFVRKGRDTPLSRAVFDLDGCTTHWRAQCYTAFATRRRVGGVRSRPAHRRLRVETYAVAGFDAEAPTRHEVKAPRSRWLARCSHPLATLRPKGLFGSERGAVIARVSIRNYVPVMGCRRAFNRATSRSTQRWTSRPSAITPEYLQRSH